MGIIIARLAFVIMQNQKKKYFLKLLDKKSKKNQNYNINIAL
jgi:hypothetical protein